MRGCTISNPVHLKSNSVLSLRFHYFCCSVAPQPALKLVLLLHLPTWFSSTSNQPKHLLYKRSNKLNSSPSVSTFPPLLKIIQCWFYLQTIFKDSSFLLWSHCHCPPEGTLHLFLLSYLFWNFPRSLKQDLPNDTY